MIGYSVTFVFGEEKVFCLMICASLQEQMINNSTNKPLFLYCLLIGRFMVTRYLSVVEVSEIFSNMIDVINLS